LLTKQGMWAKSRYVVIFQTMSEEQLKAVETEATAQVEEIVDEEISEDDLKGVAGGGQSSPGDLGFCVYPTPT